MGSGQRVDLYGYTSMTVAAVQVQAREIEVLRAEIDALRRQVDRLAAAQRERE
jgi:polyhydroxyalkanoate synthesis regulator phasin